MGRTPPLKPRVIIAILEGLGFTQVRQRGSHRQFLHPDGRGTTVPDHGGREISPALIRVIARDIGMSAADFVDRR